MVHRFALGPDINVRDLAAWFALSARLQRALGEPLKPVVHDDFAELHRAYGAGEVDLVYANAADAARLVLDHGFVAVARPVGISDEATVVVAADSPFLELEQLPDRVLVSATGAPDVERICRILLEPADLGPDDLQVQWVRNYTLVAKALLTGQAQVGFFLRAVLDGLSEVTRSRLRPLISSRLEVVSHCLLVGPALAARRSEIQAVLDHLNHDPADAGLREELGSPAGWEPLPTEDVLFMVDLIDALT